MKYISEIVNYIFCNYQRPVSNFLLAVSLETDNFFVKGDQDR